MGKVNYDWLEGITRVLKAGEKLDQRWVEIIAYHTALELELNEMLLKSLLRGEAVTGSNPRFTFGQKVAILKACWQGKADDADKLCRILFSFNELRNAVAHPDKKKTRAELKNLADAYLALVPNLGHAPTIAEIAQGVCAFMGDGIMPHDLENMANGLDHLVNVAMPKALGVKGDAADIERAG
ncbi:MAG: hypothetical protein ABI395_11125 [Sphingobium sp.]